MTRTQSQLRRFAVRVLVRTAARLLLGIGKAGRRRRADKGRGAVSAARTFATGKRELRPKRKWSGSRWLAYARRLTLCDAVTPHRVVTPASKGSVKDL
jgi:hypothetical protein